MRTREALQRIKVKSKIGVIIGLIIAIISSLVYIEADHELTKLDEGRLDEEFVK